MTDGTARLRALAKDAAVRNHVRWKQGTKKFAESGHNGIALFDCPHPDCVLVREPADAPVGLRALQRYSVFIKRTNDDPLGVVEDVACPPDPNGGWVRWADLDAALLRLGAETMNELPQNDYAKRLLLDNEGGSDGESESDVRGDSGQRGELPDGLRTGRGEGCGEHAVHDGDSVGRDSAGDQQPEGAGTVHAGRELLRGLQPRPEVDAAVDEALERAVRVTKPLRDEALKAEQIPQGLMEFRMGQPADAPSTTPRQEKPEPFVDGEQSLIAGLLAEADAIQATEPERAALCRQTADEYRKAFARKADPRPVAAPSTTPQEDVTCEHGVAMDVHCCGCHSGFLFDSMSCTCLNGGTVSEELEAVAMLQKIAVLTMTAQSNPTAKAVVYRQALIDVCNLTLTWLDKHRPELRAVQKAHWCSGCGHRWTEQLTVAELCGDCWRKAQPILHKAAPSTTERAEPLNHDGEPLHTGDDDRIDALTGIRDAIETALGELDDPDEVRETLQAAIEDCTTLDRLIIATIAREREAVSALPAEKK